MNMQRIPARYYMPAHRESVRFIVLHSTEVDASAVLLARAWQAPQSSHVSAHYIVDDVGGVQCVDEISIAWAAGPTANHLGIHIEMQGHAASPREAWCGRPLIAHVREFVADIASRWDLPLVFLDAAALLRGERGVTTHRECSAAWHETNHWDPGPGFPLDEVLPRAIDTSDPYA